MNPFFSAKGRWLTLAILVVTLLLSLTLVLLLDEDDQSVSSMGNSISSGNTQILTMGSTTQKGDPFHLYNLFPGDSETKDYVLNVKNDGVLAVTLGGEVTDETGNLSEVLRVNICRTDENEVLYTGFLKDGIELRIPLREDETKLSIRVTVSLDVSAGNEYMENETEARFSFWIADGDMVFQSIRHQPQKVWPIVVGATAGTGSLGGLVWWLVLFLKKKKQAEDVVDTALGGGNGGV